MTDLDLDRLGEMWRQRPDPAELEELKRSAEQVSRRALWGQRVDVVTSIVIAAVILLLILSSPRGDTLVVGGAALLILLASQIRSRRLRQVELKVLSGSTEEMLDQSIARLDSALKRTRFHLTLLLPGLAFGLLVASLVDDPLEPGMFSRLAADPRFETAFVAVSILLIAGAAYWLWRSSRKHRHELARLVSLKEDYRREQEVS